MEKEEIMKQIKIYKKEIDEVEIEMEELKRRKSRVIQRLQDLEEKMKEEEFSE